MPFSAAPLILSEDEQQELGRMSESRSLPAGDVLRARLILMLAEGRSYTEIQEKLNTTAPTISKWKKRFLEQRVDGKTAARHTSDEFVAFLYQVIQPCSRKQGVHIILDNLSTHKTAKVEDFLQQYPNVTHISHPPIRPGSIRWNSGLAALNVTSSHAESLPR